MACNKEYLKYVLELLSKVDNISYRHMMGEYLLYSDGILFGGTYDERFLIKKTPSNENKGLREEIPYEGSKKLMYLVDTENKDEVRSLVENAINDLK